MVVFGLELLQTSMNTSQLFNELTQRVGVATHAFSANQTTRDLILAWARSGGFENEHHVTGGHSIPALILGECGVSFACWTGTLNQVSVCLKMLFDEWGLGLDVDKFVISVDGVFAETNPEGGEVSVVFRVSGVSPVKVLAEPTKPALFAVQVRLDVIATNCRERKIRKVFVGKLTCKFSDIPSKEVIG